jgi:hypothetical protein
LNKLDECLIELTRFSILFLPSLYFMALPHCQSSKVFTSKIWTKYLPIPALTSIMQNKANILFGFLEDINKAISRQWHLQLKFEISVRSLKLIVWPQEVSEVTEVKLKKNIYILGSYKFLAYLECIRSYAWSFGHSDPDLSSVSDNAMWVKCLPGRMSVTSWSFLLDGSRSWKSTALQMITGKQQTN